MHWSATYKMFTRAVRNVVIYQICFYTLTLFVPHKQGSSSPGSCPLRPKRNSLRGIIGLKVNTVPHFVVLSKIHLHKYREVAWFDSVLRNREERIRTPKYSNIHQRYFVLYKTREFPSYPTGFALSWLESLAVGGSFDRSQLLSKL